MNLDLIGAETRTSSGFARGARAKRVFDLVVSGVALVILAPLLGLIAAAVKLESRGPVLFRQERVGWRASTFSMLKFRSMVVGAEAAGPNISPLGDPRITRVGRLLRRCYLDELPQLVNVLRGEMSLVGPRPETPEFVALYTAEERRVLTIPAGLVGPSTLRFMDEEERLGGAPEALTLYVDDILHARVRADLAYLEQRSLWYDVRLLCAQAFAILRRLV